MGHNFSEPRRRRAGLGAMRDEMGEWKIQVPAKFDSSTVERMDREIARFAPFCEGRSTMVRILVEYALAAIDDGILQWDLKSIQQVLSNSRRLSVLGIQGVPGKKR